jgi:hypothetical protein
MLNSSDVTLEHFTPFLAGQTRSWRPARTRSVSSGVRFFLSLRLRLRTFNKLVTGNVGAFLPRFQSSSADCADRVTCMRYQELLFGASVLSTASALHNCHHADDMCFGSRNFQSKQLSLFSRESAVTLWPPVESVNGGKSARLYVPPQNEATHPRCCDEGCPDGPGRASNKEGESWVIIPRSLSESIRQNRAML